MVAIRFDATAPGTASTISGMSPAEPGRRHRRLLVKPLAGGVRRLLRAASTPFDAALPACSAADFAIGAAAFAADCPVSNAFFATFTAVSAAFEAIGAAASARSLAFSTRSPARSVSPLPLLSAIPHPSRSRRTRSARSLPPSRPPLLGGVEGRPGLPRADHHRHHEHRRGEQREEQQDVRHRSAGPPPEDDRRGRRRQRHRHEADHERCIVRTSRHTAESRPRPERTTRPGAPRPGASARRLPAQARRDACPSRNWSPGHRNPRTHRRCSGCPAGSGSRTPIPDSSRTPKLSARAAAPCEPPRSRTGPPRPRPRTTPSCPPRRAR